MAVGNKAMEQRLRWRALITTVNDEGRAGQKSRGFLLWSVQSLYSSEIS